MSYRHVTRCDDGSYIVSFKEGAFTGAYTLAAGTPTSELPENTGRAERIDAHKDDRKEYTKAVKQDKLGKVARATVEAVNKSVPKQRKSTPPADAGNSKFKAGDKVMYKDIVYTVVKPYVYKDDACLRMIDSKGNKKQVFEKSVMPA
jgi:hypothetical protein